MAAIESGARFPLRWFAVSLVVPWICSASVSAQPSATDSAEVVRRLTSDDPTVAAWGAFEARTRGLRNAVPEILARLKQLPVESRDLELVALRHGLLAALVELNAPLSTAEARLCFQHQPWSTLLLIARQPEGHHAFLNELVVSCRDPSKPLWRAPRLLLTRLRDARFAKHLLSSFSPQLQVSVIDPPAGGPQVVRCAGVRRGASIHWGGFLWVPEGFPATPIWQPHLDDQPGNVLLVRAGGHALYLRRYLVLPGQSNGAAGGGSGFQPLDFERDLLLALAAAPDRLQLALTGWSRKSVWQGPEELEQQLELWVGEYEEARSTLLRRLNKYTGLELTATDGLLRPRRFLEDLRRDPGSRLALRGWTAPSAVEHPTR
jgi:hypothetical protein